MPRKSGLPRIRFQKRITLVPGLRMNLSRSGISWTGGIRGLSINAGRKGTYLNAGLPGTGLSTRTRIDGGKPPGRAAAAQVEAHSRKPRKSAFRIIVELIGAATIIAAIVSAAAAQDFQAMQTGQNIGRLIGSEAYCGLTYDQAAIEEWIAENADPADLNFSGYVDLGILGEKYDQEDRSDSAKTAHCAAVRRSAAHMGLMEQDGP